MKKMISRALCLALTLALSLTLGTAALATETPAIFTRADGILCQGQDLFTLSGAEIFTLLGTPDTRLDGGISEATSEHSVVWVYDGMELQLYVDSTRNEGGQWDGDLAQVPCDQAPLKVRRVSVSRPGIPGPRGIEVGMSLEALLALFPAQNDASADYEDFDEVPVKVLYQYAPDFASDEEREAAYAGGMGPLPPFGKVIGPIPGEAYDASVVFNYFDWEANLDTFREEAASNDTSIEYWSYIYSVQYIFRAESKDGTVTAYSLYQGATAE